MAKFDPKAYLEQVKRAAREFDRDGGLTYTEEVLKGVETNDGTLDARNACVTLSALVGLLLREYGSLVAQLEQGGTQIMSVGPMAKA